MSNPKGGKGVELANAWITIIPDTSKIAPTIKDALAGMDPLADKAGKSLGDKLTGALSKTLKVGVATAGASAAGVFGTSFAKGFSRINATENAQAKLKALGNDAQDVAGIMDNALASVKGTAFGIGEAAGTASTLVAAGVKPGTELQGVLDAVADTASIAGTNMEDMGFIFGKAAAKGKLDGEIVAQLLERQIPVYDILSKKTGEASADIADMVSKGKIDFETFNSAMAEYVGGGARVMADTFDGSLRNMGASMGRFGEALEKPFYNAAPGFFKAVTGLFDGLTAAIKPAMTVVGDLLTPAFEQLGTVIETKLAPFMATLATQFGDLAVKLTTKAVDPALWERVGDVFAGLRDTFTQLWPSVQSLAGSFLSISKNISVATWEALTGVLNALAPLITSVLVPLVEKTAEFAEQNPGAIQAIVMAFLGFKAVSGPVAVATGAIRSLGGAISILKGGEGVVRALSSLGGVGAKLGKFVGTVSKVAGFVVKGLAFVNPWVAGIAAVTGGLTLFFTQTETGKQLWSDFMGVLSGGLDFLVEKFSGFGEWWSGVWDNLSGDVSAAWNSARDFLAGAWESTKAAISAAGDFLAGVWNGIVEVGKWAFAIIATMVLTPLVLAWEAMSWAVQAAWENVIKPTWGAVAAGAQWLWNTILMPTFGFIQAGWQALGDGIRWVWENVIKTAWDAVAAGAQWLWNNALKPTFDLIVAGWQALGDAFQRVYDNAIKPVWDALVWVAQSAWDGVNVIFGWLLAGWQALGAGMRWVNENVIQPVWDAFAAGLTWLHDSVVAPVTSWIGEKWRQLGDGMAAVKDWIIDTVFGGLKSGLDTLQGWFKSAVDGIRSIWDGIKKATAAPVKFVVETVYNNGIRKAWNLVSKFTGLNELEEAQLGSLGAYAHGGVLPGYTPGRDPYNFVDPRTGTRVALSGGEGIMRPEWVRAVGGEAAVNQMNKAAISGGVHGVQKLLGGDASGFVRKFAKGGVFHPNGDTKRKEEVSDKVVDAQNFVRSQHGKPYQWGGVGNPSWDCSGLWSGIVQVINGGNGFGGRLFNTTSFMQNPGRFGFSPGLHGPVTVGVSNDHMAGTLGGINAESASMPKGVQLGGSAWGSDNGYFTNQYTMDAILGEFISGGAGGGGGGFNLGAMVKGIWDGIIDRIPSWSGPGLIGQLPGAMLKGLAEAAWNTVKENIKSVFGGSSGSAGNAESWREMAMWAMRREGFNADDPAQVNAMLAQIMSESGGIPDRNQEIVDINGTGASAGQGLLQIIPGTFAAYRDPELPDDRTNPEANMVAALRYYRARYGTDLTTMWGHGHGYASGGVLPGYTPGRDVHQFFSPTAGWLGLSGGEAIMVPEWTRSVGGPQAVAAMNKAARAGRTSGGQGFADGGVFAAAGGVGFGDAVGSLKAAADEIAYAFRGADFGYGELAAVLRNEQWAKSIVDGAAMLGKIADATSLEGIAARSAANEVGGILGSIGLSQSANVITTLISAEQSLLDARQGHADRLADIAQREKDLEEMRKKLRVLEEGESALDVKDQRKLADAEAALAKARKEAGAAGESTTAQTRKITDAENALAKAREGGDADKIAAAEERLTRAREDADEKNVKSAEASNEKVQKAEENLRRVREDLGIKEEKDAEKRAEDIEKANADIVKAEQELLDARKASAKALDVRIFDVAPQINGMLVQAAAATTAVPAVSNALAGLAAAAGPAGVSVGVAVQALKSLIQVVQLAGEVFDHVAGSVMSARMSVIAAVGDVLGAAGELAEMGRRAREDVTSAVIAFNRAQLDLAAAQRNMRIVAMDGVTSQLKGVKSLREAQSALDNHMKKSASTWKGYYIDLTYGAADLGDQLEANAARAAEALQAWDDEAMALLFDVKAQEMNLILLQQQAQLANLEAAFKYQQAVLDSNDAMSELLFAVARFDAAAKAAFGFDVSEATVGQRYAQLQSEKAQLQADQASFKTWINPVNWFTSMPAAQRRIRQIDDQLAEIAAMPEFRGLDAETMRQVESLGRKATVMGLFGAGDRVQGMVNNSALGDAQRALDEVKFQNSLIDIKKSNVDLQSSIDRAALELAYRRESEPLQTQIQATEMLKARDEAMAEYWRSDSRGVRDAIDALAQNYDRNARELNAIAGKQRDVTIQVPAGKTAFDLAEVNELVRQFNSQVEDVRLRLAAQERAGRASGLDVSALVRG